MYELMVTALTAFIEGMDFGCAYETGTRKSGFNRLISAAVSARRASGSRRTKIVS